MARRYALIRICRVQQNTSKYYFNTFLHNISLRTLSKHLQIIPRSSLVLPSLPTQCHPVPIAEWLQGKHCPQLTSSTSPCVQCYAACYTGCSQLASTSSPCFQCYSLSTPPRTPPIPAAVFTRAVNEHLVSNVSIDPQSLRAGKLRKGYFPALVFTVSPPQLPIVPTLAQLQFGALNLKPAPLMNREGQSQTSWRLTPVSVELYNGGFYESVLLDQSQINQDHDCRIEGNYTLQSCLMYKPSCPRQRSFGSEK